MWPVVLALCSLASHTIAFAQSCGRIDRRVRVRCAYKSASLVRRFSVVSELEKAILYFSRDWITRLRGNIADPATTVAGAIAFTRTWGPSLMASSRTRWFNAALLVS